MTQWQGVLSYRCDRIAVAGSFFHKSKRKILFCGFRRGMLVCEITSAGSAIKT
jgi:hypothetical protein